jgi:hypothetical protein
MGLCPRVQLVAETHGRIAALASSLQLAPAAWQLRIKITNQSTWSRSGLEYSLGCCLYDSYGRECCPIVLGHTDGEEKSLVYLFGGESSRGKAAAKDWKCLTLSKVRDARLQDGLWHGGQGPHDTAQSCVKDVDVDVNPNSPYNPKRRLPPPGRQG